MNDKYDIDTDTKTNIDNNPTESALTDDAGQEVQSRRAFLIGMGKWSRAVIAGAIVGGGMTVLERPAQAGWLNRRGCCAGGGWINGGGSWANRRGGGWGGSWINRR
jgi:hypothetical protein